MANGRPKEERFDGIKPDFCHKAEKKLYEAAHVKIKRSGV